MIYCTDTGLIIVPNVIRQTDIHELLNSGQGYFRTPDSCYTIDTKSSKLPDTILLNTEYYITES